MKNLAVDARGDVHAEERVAGVGHRVDEPVDEVAPFGLERVVLAAERHDRRVWAVAGQLGKPIALQSATDDDLVEGERSGIACTAGGYQHLGAGRTQTDDFVPEQYLRAVGDRVGGKSLRHLGEVDDRGRR